MSCHFHLMRRRRASQAAQDEKNAAESDFKQDHKTNTQSVEKTKETASERRRKALQKKGDSE